MDEEQRNKTLARRCANSGDTRIVLQEVRSLAVDFGCLTADLVGTIGMANLAGMAVQSRIRLLSLGNSRSICTQLSLDQLGGRSLGYSLEM